LTSERVERRLAAVLAADVAGYSRLMGADEEGTLARLKAIRKTLVDPTIAAHRGRIVKTTGDGLLVEFASAVDAARCAVEVQRDMTGQNTDFSQERHQRGGETGKTRVGHGPGHRHPRISNTFTNTIRQSTNDVTANVTGDVSVTAPVT
jgi:class 3 adenylate cyclase